MGNADSKINFRKSVVQLTTRTQPVDAGDEAFWSQFWSDSATCVQDVFTLIPAAEIRALREESPSNLATLCYKAVEKLVQVAETGCRNSKDERMIQNCIRLLTRLLPYIFEDTDWRGFFWTTMPGQWKEDDEHSDQENSVPLAQSLISALCDLLFCPDFTVWPHKKSGPDSAEDMSNLDSCEFIWAAGVGFTNQPYSTSTIEQNRTELLKLLLTCFSETMYLPSVECQAEMNHWIRYFTSIENRHALPLFTSLLNVVCSYDPVGYGLPYNYLMFHDAREPLVEVALHILCVCLDSNQNINVPSTSAFPFDSPKSSNDYGELENLFIIYLSRIHREEDFNFILKGLTRLLNNPLTQTYLPASSKRIHFHQELLVFFWKICDINKKFMFHVLKSSDVLDILVPVLYYLNDARTDQSRVGLMHIGVFILLLLSGERNFGVRLNKPYCVRVPMDVPVFTGSHADLLVIVFHKIITTGHQKLQPLFDCLLTIIVNVSPYLKTLSMVSSAKLLHLLEAFSTPWFLLASPSNHHLVFFLLEVFNNIIQYQFDGNSNLVYTLIRKRQVFHQLASMPTDNNSICKALSKSSKKLATHKETMMAGTSAEIAESEDRKAGSSTPELPGQGPKGEAGTLQATLAATPGQIYSHSHYLPSSDFNNNRQVIYNHFNTNKSSRKNLIDFHRYSLPSLTTRSASVHQRHLENLMFFDESYKDDASVFGAVQGNVKDDSSEVESCRIIERKKSLAEVAANKNPNDESSEVKAKLIELIGIENMTEKSRAMNLMTEEHELDFHSDLQNNKNDNNNNLKDDEKKSSSTTTTTDNYLNDETKQDLNDKINNLDLASNDEHEDNKFIEDTIKELSDVDTSLTDDAVKGHGDTDVHNVADDKISDTIDKDSIQSPSISSHLSSTSSRKTKLPAIWSPTTEWVQSWKQKLPLQTIMRLLQVLVPQVEKICIDKGLTDESEIIKFLQHGTLVGLLPVPHPILIRKYQANSGTTMWFRTYMWGVIYLRNVDPPIWYDTDVKLFEIQRV